MGLILVGIDEAGYGPLLGPLSVGMAAFRVERWSEGDTAPDLWSLMETGVSRTVRDGRGRVAVADSKELKLPNDCVKRHPLTHLERGVLSFLFARGLAPRNDAELLESLGAALPGHDCYVGEPHPLPLASTPDQIGIATNMLLRAMERGGVEPVDLACQLVAEPLFNEIVKRTGSKAEATSSAIERHLRRVCDRFVGAAGGDAVRVVCDRLGGRTAYAGLLARMMPGAEVRVLDENEQRSRYTVVHPRGVFGVQFQVESEKHHLPVALASMAAKLVRELAMMRFNRHWCGRLGELKPTAGYRPDGRRWLEDAAAVLTGEDRLALVRIA